MTFYRKWGTEMLEELPKVPQLLQVYLIPEPAVCCGTWLSESVFPNWEGEAVELTLS